MRNRGLPLHMPDDSEEFYHAHCLLKKLGAYYTRPSPHQLKIGSLNYYPKTGTITIDGFSHAYRNEGLDGLEAHIHKMRERLELLLELRAEEARHYQPDEDGTLGRRDD